MVRNILFNDCYKKDLLLLAENIFHCLWQTLMTTSCDELNLAQDMSACCQTAKIDWNKFSPGQVDITNATAAWPLKIDIGKLASEFSLKNRMK